MKTSLLHLIAFILFTRTISLKAQSNNYLKQIVNFESNKSDLTSKHKKMLNKCFDTLITKYIVKKIFVKGNTDNVGDSIANNFLALKRAQTVTTYLKSKGILNKAIKVLSFGEKLPIATNENETGKLKNRRVELIILYEPRPILISAPIVETKKKVYGYCDQDTTLKLQQGSVVTINKCDYNRMKGCISIQEYSSQQSLLSSDLNTMTGDGVALISGGMFTINLCKEDTCIEKPIKIRVPYNDSCLGDARLTLWDVTIGNRWGNSTSKGLKLITEDGKKFYEFEVSCSGGKNLDVKITNFIKYNINVNFILKKRRVKLIEVKLAYNCPNAVIVGGNGKPRKSIAVKGFCSDNEPFVYAKAVTKRGDTLVMDYLPISTLTFKEAYCNCDKATIKSGGKKAKKDEAAKFPLHKKYFLKRNDFEKVSNNNQIVKKD